MRRSGIQIQRAGGGAGAPPEGVPSVSRSEARPDLKLRLSCNGAGDRVDWARMAIPRILTLVLVLAALAGCATYVPEPDALMAGGDDGRLADLKAGRQLYINKCGGCHSLMPVDRFDAARWTAEVEEMTTLKKVRLSPDDQAKLLLYLTTAPSRPR